jgi:hypothetical protein
MSFTDPDWTPLLEMTFEPEQPIRSEQGVALYGNPVALINGKLGAPIIQPQWHPFLAVTWGDGQVGLVYDHSIHGAVSSVDLGAVAAGYEYRVIYEQIRISTGQSRVLYFDVEVGGTYRAIDMLTMSGIANEFGQYTIYRYTGCSVAHMVGTARTAYMLSSDYTFTSDTSSVPNPAPYVTGAALNGGNSARGVGIASADMAVPTNMRLRLSGATLSAGKAWLHRRKVAV